MSIKKTLLLASAVLALVAFAVPASASAATAVTDNGATLTNVTIEATGNAKFELAGTGIECTEVRGKVLVNGTSVDVTAFEVLNPTTKCTFFGLIYGGCEFEQHPVTTNLPLGVDLIENKDEATITKSTNAGTPDGAIDAELKAQAGKTCNITTNDITILHNATNSVTIDLETNVGGFIEGLKLTGTVKVDSAGSAAGTTTTNHTASTASIGGTLKLALPNTYKLN